ncbi:complex I NDUFA9 subunit family protein [uncultured Thioclava sp.]|uniref:complex I NDUFA9 subunit family protein n=1 Tax=uncultured Thioclava sp. TaxID=473858 RepID=UPI0025CD1FF8|nr:complex I NDUFA9 subunit family protein [uncultured Thioclava sp.]
MSKLVTIYGGSGFVGRYIARSLAKEGWRIRVAVRRPNEALFVKSYGAVGQVEPVLCNIRDEDSVRAVMFGADAVINCVGILVNEGKNKFDSVQTAGAARVARIAAEQGIAKLVQISAIGADADSQSAYARSKAAGETAVLEAYPQAVILRPSIIFGNEDGFFNKFAAMSRLTPVVPITGGDTKFQPVYVDDVAQVAAMAANGNVIPGIYELGGPDVETFRDLVKKMLGVINRRRFVVSLPFWLAGVMGGVFDLVQTVSGGLLVNRILTRDQVKNLRADNVVAADAKGFADLGITPMAMDAVLEGYLWRFRPGGQYDAIKASAKNLHKSL